MCRHRVSLCMRSDDGIGPAQVAAQGATVDASDCIVPQAVRNYRRDAIHQTPQHRVICNRTPVMPTRLILRANRGQVLTLLVKGTNCKCIAEFQVALESLPCGYVGWPRFKRSPHTLAMDLQSHCVISSVRITYRTHRGRTRHYPWLPLCTGCCSVPWRRNAAQFKDGISRYTRMRVP
jgi:hypothetical protein